MRIGLANGLRYTPERVAFSVRHGRFSAWREAPIAAKIASLAVVAALGAWSAVLAMPVLALIHGLAH
jgi:hypothetical protein